jgi:predicted transcriptional regulator
MERHLDVTASEKRQERVGFEGLNQRVTDLNAFVKELRGENKELQGQIEQAKKALRDELSKKDKEVE